MIKNIIYIPYHDWRKIEDEGSRTRDAHFIEVFRKSSSINKFVVVNRPITRIELLLKKKRLNSKIKGKIVTKKNGHRLIQIDTKTYLLDFLENKNMNHIIKGRKWYFEAFRYKSVQDFFQSVIGLLEIDQYIIISANIFAEGLLKNKQSELVIFDAWDNFLKLPSLVKNSKELVLAYQGYCNKAKNWITNTENNLKFFKKNFNVKSIRVISNGVDSLRFNNKLPTPPDLIEIKNLNKPIIGFGGKISHLVDYELLNYLTYSNKDFSFVIIGQILDKDVFKRIVKRNNLFYLGDKHYNSYPSYVTNFDIGIIPYVTGNKEHGGESIKTYEYLAAGIPVVATNGNGVEKLKDYVNVVDNKEEFSSLIRNPAKKDHFQVDSFHWEQKAKQLLEIFDDNKLIGL